MAHGKYLVDCGNVVVLAWPKVSSWYIELMAWLKVSSWYIKLLAWLKVSS